MSFVNPLFLFGALAAAVPILLHLIKREHARKIEFPTLMFLRRISKKTIRYQKLRHLLLLLLRILALLLIVLAFMRPYRERARSAVAQGGITSTHVIVLDNSMSMGYQDRWAQARKAAAGIVRGSEPDDKFVVLEFSDNTVARTQITADPSEALTQIESGVEVSDRPTRYEQALKIAERFALDAGTGKRIIHLISDFQKNGWGAEEQEFHLGAGIELKYVDVGSDSFSNLTVRDARVIQADQNIPAEMQIKASVMNFGNQDRKNARVSLSVEGRPVGEKRINIAAGSSQGIEFQLPSLLPGMHPIVIEVEDPNLPRDNRFYLTIEERGKTPVLAVENQDTRGRRSPSFFLARALNVDTLSPYKLTAVAPKNLVLSGRLVIWNDVPGGGATVQGKLQNFVKSGGGLVLVLGNSTQPSDFNRGFGSWLPIKMVEGSSSGRRLRNRPVDDYILMTDVRMDNPIFQPFNKPHSGTFSNARFFSHARITVGPEAEVPARFDNGDPALVSLNIGKGRVLLFTSSADDAANDLPLKAVYAPFWQQMLRYLENYREQRQWLNVGDIIDPQKLLTATAPLQAKWNPDLSEPFVVLDPKKRRMSVAPASDSVSTDQAGFYEIRSMNLNFPVAVNTPAKESDLAHGNAEEMTAGWMSSKPAVFSQDEQPSAEEQDRRQRIWVLVLIAALVFLISESLVSNYELRITNAK